MFCQFQESRCYSSDGNQFQKFLFLISVETGILITIVKTEKENPEVEAWIL